MWNFSSSTFGPCGCAFATFGERAEDVLQITDERDRALVDPKQQEALRAALLACLDGEGNG